MTNSTLPDSVLDEILASNKEAVAELWVHADYCDPKDIVALVTELIERRRAPASDLSVRLRAMLSSVYSPGRDQPHDIMAEAASALDTLTADKDYWFREAEDRANSCSLILRRAETAEADLASANERTAAAERERDEAIRKMNHEAALSDKRAEERDRAEALVVKLNNTLLDVDEVLTAIENYGGEPAVRARRARQLITPEPKE